MEHCGRCGQGHAGECLAGTLALPAAAAAEEESLVGSTLGNYRLLRELGRGSTGVVYLAENSFIGAKVAVKAMRRELAGDAQWAKRFLAEARAAGKLHHPNTLQVLDLLALPDGRPCIVMERLDGETLEQRMSARELPRQEALEVLGQVCDALQAAHQAGIIHRDIKAENVLLVPRPGRQELVKVLDFGIARLIQEAGLTAPGLVLGTPDYMAPEQVMGQPVDARADLYAVGVLAYRLLVGRLPFAAATAPDAMIKRVREDPPDFELPGPMKAVVLRALARDPAGRYQSAAELGQALRLCAGVPEDPAGPPVRCQLEPGLVRVLFAQAAALERAEREELSKGRLYVPSEVAPPTGPVNLSLEAPGRVPRRLRAEVVMVAGREQAKAWGMPAGFALALSKDKSAPPPPPGSSKTAAVVLHELEPVLAEPYAVLGLTPEATMPEVRHALQRRVEEVRAASRNADADQARRLHALSARLEQVRHDLAEPAGRARHDGICGHYKGVARALAGGLTSEELASLHAEFGARHPDRVHRAAEVVRTAEMHLRVRDNARALVMYEHALTLDPLDLSLQQAYWALKREMAAQAASPTQGISHH